MSKTKYIPRIIAKMRRIPSSKPMRNAKGTLHRDLLVGLRERASRVKMILSTLTFQRKRN